MISTSQQISRGRHGRRTATPVNRSDIAHGRTSRVAPEFARDDIEVDLADDGVDGLGMPFGRDAMRIMDTRRRADP